MLCRRKQSEISVLQFVISQPADLKCIRLIIIRKYVFIYFLSNNFVSLYLNKTIIIYSVIFGKRKCAPVMHASHILLLWNSGHCNLQDETRNEKYMGTRADGKNKVIKGIR